MARTNEDEALLRKSAPKPGIMDYIKGAINGMKGVKNGAVDGFEALEAPIGKEAVHEATLTLQKYKEGKANLDRRIVENEEWYRLRHWACLRKKEPNMVEPTSAWLFNSIENKHADAMDNAPEPNVLPREEGDKAEAEQLSSILPVILDENDFEAVYDDVWRYKLKFGTGVYGVFWDSSKLRGLGDISVKKIDILELFWQPGITNIQDSRNIFLAKLIDNEVLISQYPKLQGKLSNPTVTTARYIYDDSVDTSDKSAVIDWYYKKTNSQGQSVLHYVKYVNDEVLFATENAPEYKERGLYDHGEYPFVFDPLFKTEGTPTGFGYIDVAKSAQEYIDRGNQAIMQNMLSNARPRFFCRNDGSVNEAEFTDMTKDIVHVDGNLGQDSIIPIQGKPLNDIYVSVINNKIEELKEVTGNRDVSTGGTTGGVTAASAIAAMQEAGSKLSRDANKSAYRAFRDICLLCIELIRQFYDIPRTFRIIGTGGIQKFVMYSNENIKGQPQGMDFGIDMGVRVPIFDINVVPQKASPYTKLSQNELALQLYGARFFDPMMANQALMCLEMMDFDGKDELIQKVQAQGGMLQQMMMLAQMVDSMRGGNEIQTAIAQQYGLAPPAPTQMEVPNEEPSVTREARERTAEATAPR